MVSSMFFQSWNFQTSPLGSEAIQAIPTCPTWDGKVLFMRSMLQRDPAAVITTSRSHGSIMAQRGRPPRGSNLSPSEILNKWRLQEGPPCHCPTSTRQVESTNPYNLDISWYKYIMWQVQHISKNKVTQPDGSCQVALRLADLRISVNEHIFIKWVAFLPSHWQGITISLSGHGQKQFRFKVACCWLLTQNCGKRGRCNQH